MKGVQETNRATGAFEILGGPCCESPACPSREAWPYPGETIDDMKARLTSKYGRAPWEAQTHE